MLLSNAQTTVGCHPREPPKPPDLYAFAKKPSTKQIFPWVKIWDQFGTSLILVIPTTYSIWVMFPFF